MRMTFFHSHLTCGFIICKYTFFTDGIWDKVHQRRSTALKSTVLPRSIAKILVCPDFPPLKIPRYTAKLSYRHPPQVFRHKSRKTNLNSPISTAHNYLLTAVY